MEELVYTVDDRDHIIYVNHAWDLFAIANDAPELSGPHVLGRSIFDFIQGAESRHMTSMLLRRARSAGATIAVPFRCDSSREKRALEMLVTPVGDSVEIRTRLRHAEPRHTVPLLDRDRLAAMDLLTLCSWCNRVKVDGEWLELEEAAARLGLFQVPVLPTLTHGICKACIDSVFS
jgi:hypothetical protein